MTPTGNTVIKLPESKMNDAADLLARAFFDDPLMLYLFPDDLERRDMGKRFFLPNMKHAAQQGQLYTTDTFKGVAVWRFFGIEPEAEKGSDDDPRAQLPANMGSRCISKADERRPMHHRNSQKIDAGKTLLPFVSRGRYRMAG